jgi:hypothetical protein
MADQALLRNSFYFRTAWMAAFHPTEPIPMGIANVRYGARPCENVREPRKRRTVFSIAFFG